MKKRTLVSILSVILLLAATLSIFTSCAASTGGTGGYNGGAEAKPGYGDGGIMNDVADNSGLGTLPSGSADAPGAKIIKTANATVQAKEYEAFLSAVSEKIKQYGGYTDAESYSGSLPHRESSITVRIPAEHFESFRTDLNTLGTLSYFSAKKDDVSMTYATLTAKVETLTLEVGVVEELFAIAKEGGDLTKIAELEERLTDIKLELAEARAKLSAIDNSVAYSTVYLTVIERVDEAVLAPKEEKGVFARIGENLLTNLKDIGSFFVELFVFLVSALPYIVIIGAVTAGIILLVKFIKRKNKKDD